MKKIFCLILTLLLILPVISGCVGLSEGKGDTTQLTDTEKREEISDSDTDKSETNDESATESESISETVTENESISETVTENESENSDIVIPPTEGYINPVFSHYGGIYAEAISLSLKLPKGCDGYEIYYTVDGSIPSVNSKSSKKYTEAINLPEKTDSTVIRAACFDSDGKIAGRVETNTYILNPSGKYGVWTVSITAVPYEFNKINGSPFDSIEIPANAEMITPDGERVISQTVGLKIFGGSSRSLPQKSFKLTARKEGYFHTDIYNGKGSFSYPLFPDRLVKSGVDAGQVLDKYDSIVLRNGGNDSLQATACEPLKASLVRDSLSNRFAAAVCDTFDYAHTQFARVYVNGEYYGVLDMRENMNDNYVKNIYGVNDDDVIVIKSELDTTRACPEHSNPGYCRYCGSWFFYECDSQKELADWIALCKKAIAANEQNYDSVFAEIESKIDLDSFIEFTALNLYLCNTDWPHNNIKIWRYTGEAVDGIEITDGKWRFMYRDMDFTFGRYSNGPTAELKTTADVDTFYRTLGNYIDYGYDKSGYDVLYNDALYLQGLLNFLLKNDEFRAKFTAFCEKLASDESKTVLLGLLSETYDELQPLIKEHLACWRGTYDPSYNMKTFGATKVYIKSFIESRPDYFISYLEKAMSYYN